MIDRGMLAALGLSLGMHAWLLGGGLQLPAPVQAELPEPFVVRAALLEPEPVAVPAPAPVQVAALKPVPVLPAAKPAKPTAIAPQPELAAEVPVEALADVPFDSPSAGEADGGLLEQALPPPVLAATAEVEPSVEVRNLEGWPAQGSIVYRVFLGSGGLQVGESRHEWSHDERRYRMSVRVETTGVAALLNRLHYTQRSEGELGPHGLKPQRFVVDRSGRATESAEFDWDAGRVSLRRGARERRTASISPGDQDVLSVWHQIGIIGQAGLPLELSVVTSKSAKPATLERVGDEPVQLPVGRLDALRLRARAADGSLTIDIWLARNYGMLPVRIRMVDDEGEVLDQQAIQLRLSPPGVAADDTATSTAMIELEEEEPDPLAQFTQD